MSAVPLEPFEGRRAQFLATTRFAAWTFGVFVTWDLVTVLALGFEVPRLPIALEAAWVAVCLAAIAVARRLGDQARLERLFTASFLGHTVAITIALITAGGGWFVGALPFALVVVAAVANLQPRGAMLVVAAAGAAWTSLVLVQLIGLYVPTPILGMPPLVGNVPMALTQVAGGMIGLAAVAILTNAQVRNARRYADSWALLIDTAPDLILTLDRDGHILSANGTALRVTGWGREQLVGQTLLAFVDDDAELVSERLAEVVRGSGGRFVHRFRCLDGGMAWLEVSAAPVEEEGRVVGVLLTARDVTSETAAAEEREMLQHELAQGQRLQAVGQLVSGVAHELNNPLTAVLAFTEQLRDEETDPEKRETLAMVHREALRSRDIVRDLLAVVRKRENKVAHVLTWGQLIRRVEPVLRSQVESGGAAFRLVHDGRDTPFAADTMALEQVLTNLVVNAAHAAGRGGTVTVRIGGTHAFAQLFVEDTGPGIPADVLGRIFEPFFSTKPEGEGTGLGLSVSLGIVQQVGGTLRAENRRPEDGGGARFTVTIPRAAGDAPSGDAIGAAAPAAPPARRRTPLAMPIVAPPRQALPDGSGPLVLIVDDETVIRRVLRRFFEKKGFRILEATNGADALRILDCPEVQPDLVISDLRMPGVGGIELHAWLVEHRPALLPRLLIATGDIVGVESAAFIERANCRVLEKPFDLVRLNDVVTDVLATAPT